MSFIFNSEVIAGPTIAPYTAENVKNEPMLFSCSRLRAQDLDGDITRRFIAALPDDWYWADDLIIDSRVHMLMPNWYPCIPGFHHDDVPRDRSDGQPNYHNPSYKAQHVMMITSQISATQFALGEAEFPEVDIGKVCYREWHPMVLDKLKSGELRSWSAPSNQLIFFDWNTWHQGVKSVGSGWRFFIRASRFTGRKPTNEIRRQVQVYLEAPMDGW